MRVELLQRVFRTFSDPTRVRIVALLEREELAVHEIMQVLGMAQSRISRHLAILREAALLEDRRDGTFAFYRFVPPAEGPWRDAWALIAQNLRGDPTAERDAAALARVLESRSERARSFFDAVGPEWDALRKVFNDDVLRARAISRLIDPNLVVADIGTGTGILALELARLGARVIAIDHSTRMLDAARVKSAAEPELRIEFRHGEASRLPIADAEVDAALAHMVLHYLPSPADAIAEMARVVRPGGSVVVVDFTSHQHDWMRHELGVVWLGFSADEIEHWFRDVGLVSFRLDVHAGLASSRELPAAFIAAARRPA
ncbi:MAG TPA: metalloregulator ArsR/SmtB family transcription factor [Myxococcota bacterium]|nr:metalloregulator ArsR/SmtB family transcription factor [Myxococcota bacterium]